MNSPPVTKRRDDGVVNGTGESYTVSWDANDPRIAGTATIILNETDYRVGATTLAPTGEAGTMRTGLLRIVNDDGTWEGPYTELLLEDDLSSERDSNTGWLTGADRYEGLSAYVVFYHGGAEAGTFRGHITAEGPPPVPGTRPACLTPSLGRALWAVARHRGRAARDGRRRRRPGAPRD